jgi:phage baseplate assembly protein W
MADLNIRAREKVYTDLDFAFRANPVTGDVSLKKDVEAVKQSVLNILKTRRGEKPFLPNFGSGIHSYLFEPIDSVTKAMIEEDVIFSLRNYEPRVRILSIVVDDLADQNAINIRLDLEIISPVVTTTTIEFIVQRLR